MITLDQILDESHLLLENQSLVYRLKKRAEIRRQMPKRKSVQRGEADRLADLLEEAALKILELDSEIEYLASEIAGESY